MASVHEAKEDSQYWRRDKSPCGIESVMICACFDLILATHTLNTLGNVLIPVLHEQRLETVSGRADYKLHT